MWKNVFLVFEIILNKLLDLNADNNLRNIKLNIFISTIIIIFSFYHSFFQLKSSQKDFRLMQKITHLINNL